MDKKMKLDFELNFKSITDINSSFAAAKCIIAYAGKNRNKSRIEKEIFENAQKSIKNIPVVGRYDEEKSMFGSHDIKVVTDKDGDMSIVNATVPFGVVPESAEQEWITLEVDGVEKECYVTDVILWKRQHGYEHLKEKGKVWQSMEINVNDFEIEDDGYFNIKDFTYEALCLLESAEPCFENASLQVFSKDICENFETQFSFMLKELKDINIGGTKLDKQELLTKYNVKTEDLDFSIEEMTYEELDIKLQELYKESDETETAETGISNGEETPKENHSKNFAILTDQKRNLLSEKINGCLSITDGDKYIGEIATYLIDFDDDYVYCRQHCYGEIDEKDMRYKAKYTFDKTTLEVEIDEEKHEVFVNFLTLEEMNSLESLNNLYESYKKSHSYSNEEYRELETFKEQTIKREVEKELDLIIDEFKHELNDYAEFDELVKGKSKFTKEELRKECLYIRGLHTVTNKTGANKGNTSISFSIDGNKDNETNQEPYYMEYFKKHAK